MSANRRDKYGGQGVSDWVDQVVVDGNPTTVPESIPDLAAYDAHLAKDKHLPISDFKSGYSRESSYLEKINFDPASAKYYNEFFNPAARPPNTHYKKTASFALSPEARKLFTNNGFVVIQGEKSNFSREYYRIFNNDLPVFITADSMLHAFHMSYDYMLEELETTYFTETISTILNGMASQLKQLSEELKACNATSLLASCQDADLFIAVARNLLASENIIYVDSPNFSTPAAKPEQNKEQEKRKGPFMSLFGKMNKSQHGQGEPDEEGNRQIASVFGNDIAVSKLLQECFAASSTSIELFGRKRDIDFSQMKPRGHYAKSESLRRYFRAMMWCGRIDMKVAGEGSTTRELGAAALLHTLLSRTKGAEQMWAEMNNLLECLVGVPNSMTFPQLGEVLNKSCKLKDCLELNSEDALQKVQQAILETKYGIKQYNSDLADSLGTGKKNLPRAFTFMGQRFGIDSWAMSKFVTDQVYCEDQKVLRKRTSAIEVAFSVFANDATVPIIAERIEDTSAKNFRDGLPYQQNLAAVRKTIDELPADAWKSSLYIYWLKALRALSEPITDEKFPQAMRTKAYAMKNLNTQIASWSQLRHDNLLYVEPVYDFRCGCEYPAGFVEPLVNFWKALEDMCLVLANVLQQTPIPPHRRHGSIIDLQKNQVDFLNTFAKHVRVLHNISVKELAQQPLDDIEAVYLKTIVEGVGFMSGMSMWGGWYPDLYYGGLGRADDEDLIVGDVFTANPDPQIGDKGSVLHESLGHPRIMLISVDNGAERCTYAGPVFTHYEFELEGLQRYADKDWENKVKKNEVPPLPVWTQYYSQK